MVELVRFFMCPNVIGVIGAFNHSIRHRVNKLQRRDWVIGKKATIWGYIRTADNLKKLSSK